MEELDARRFEWMHARFLPAIFLLAGSLSAAGCGQARQPRAAVKESRNDDCHRTTNKGVFFYGSFECMKQSPEHTYKGFYIKSYETSIFSESYLKLGEVSVDKKQYWVTEDSGATGGALHDLKEGRYCVTFKARSPEQIGAFGFGTALSYGMLVTQIVSARTC